MFEAHRRRSAQVTIAAVPAKDKAEYGSIVMDEDGRILKFSEKTDAKDGRLINAGVYVFERTVIDAIADSVPLSLEKDVFPRLVAGRLLAYRCKGPLLDIGSPERYALAQKELIGLMKRAFEDKG
jgi:mannose-1-phosphate guanylyltransferase